MPLSMYLFDHYTVSVWHQYVCYSVASVLSVVWYCG